MSRGFGFLTRRRRESLLKRKVILVIIFIIFLELTLTLLLRKRVESYLFDTLVTLSNTKKILQKTDRDLDSRREILSAEEEALKGKFESLKEAIYSANNIYTPDFFYLLRALSVTMSKGIYLLSLDARDKITTLKGISESSMNLNSYVSNLNRVLQGTDYKARIKEERVSEGKGIYFEMEIKR